MRVARALQVLGLDEGSDAAAIELRWRRLRSELHPDRNPDADTSRAFDEARTAYEIALAFARAPRTCDACGGTGRQETRRGWIAVTLRCPACAGAGAIHPPNDEETRDED